MTSRSLRPGFSRGAGLLALASLIELAATGCNGESAFRARSPDAGWSQLGGTFGSGGASTGTGGVGSGGSGVGTGGSVVATGGAGGAGNNVGSGGAAGAGQGGTTGTGGAGGLATGTIANGSPCPSGSGSDCKSGYCADGTCCQTACTGNCRSCNNATGTCTLAPSGMDPRKNCSTASDVSTCGSNGMGCNGSGACILWPANTVCNATATCDATNSSVIPNHVCNGGGTCVANTPTSCNGFLCSTGACGTTCSSDSDCVSGGFCTGGTCIGVPNLAGNGDLESGTLTGWSAVQGGSISLSSTASSGVSHGGQYSIESSSRSANYSGPGYAMPTGLGQYLISAWVMQEQDTMSNIVVQVRLQCKGNTYYATVQTGSTFGQTLASGAWTQFNATIDFNNVQPSPLTDDCIPTSVAPTTPTSTSGPGLIESAFVFANQVNSDSPTPYLNPNLYMDDLVIQAIDGHNLVGNPNFEAGLVYGWNVNGQGSATLAVSSTIASSGTKSLWLKNRTSATAGIAYALPIGIARYSVSFDLFQNGTMPSHPLALEAVYSCISAPGTYITDTNNMVTATVPPNQWTTMKGTFVFPPTDATGGCQLASAAIWVVQAESGACGAIECPDLFLDNASISLK